MFGELATIFLSGVFSIVSTFTTVEVNQNDACFNFFWNVSIGFRYAHVVHFFFFNYIYILLLCPNRMALLLL
jgi:hypothetical protein